MCGRYTLTITNMADHFKVTQGEIEFSPSYNVAPTQAVPVVLERGGERLLTPAKWGLLPNRILLAKSVTPLAERSAMSASGL